MMDAVIKRFEEKISLDSYFMALGWCGWDNLRAAMASRGQEKCCCEDGKWTHFSDGVARNCLICKGTGKLINPYRRIQSE